MAGAASSPAWKTVSYHGVSLSVPAAWPTIDGSHYPGCGFPADPPVYFGAGSVLPSCAAWTPGEAPRYDGVWAYPAPGPPPPGSDTSTVIHGQTAYTDSSAGPSEIGAWYHGLEIQIGVGPDPTVSQRILSSLTWDPSRPDTPLAGSCPSGTPSTAMPTPQTVTATMTLEAGNSTLSPPASEQQPAVPASDAWQQYQKLNQAGSPGRTARLLLGLYSADTPAAMNPNGSATPLYQHRLSWVVYITPAQSSMGGDPPKPWRHGL